MRVVKIKLLLIGLLTVFTVSVVQAQVPRGIAVTPRNFPNFTSADVDEAFEQAQTLGQQAVFIYQWSQLDLDVVRLMLAKARQHNLIPILGLSPTSLGKGRKEIDAPSAVRVQAGTELSFANPVVRRAYIKEARALAKLKPPYLCLATEINLLGLQRLPEYLQFVTLYKEAYQAVKRVSPQTKVFVSFQWEWVRILDAKDAGRLAEHSKLIDIFRPRLDLVAFTTYPSAFYAAPAQLPADYYTWMSHHLPPHEPVMFMEVGWPTAGNGSETEQRDFIARLPELMKGINVIGLEWALLHDVQVGAFDANLNSVGLRYRDDRPKPGYDRFRSVVLPGDE